MKMKTALLVTFLGATWLAAAAAPAKTEGGLIEGIAALRRLDSLETFCSPTDEATRIMREVGGAPFGIKCPKSASGALASIRAAGWGWKLAC